jgi:hypothetical protein
MTVTALFATAGATNAGLYPAIGLGDHLATTGQFPSFMAKRVGGKAWVGLLAVAAAVILMVLAFDLSAIASIGSAVALAIFGLVTIGHLRIREATGARLSLLLLAVATTLIALVTFVFTTLINEPASIVTLVGIIVVSAVLDRAWSRPRSEPGLGTPSTAP